MFGQSLIDASPPGPLIESIVGIGEVPELFHRRIASHLHFHKSGIFNFRFNSLRYKKVSFIKLSILQGHSTKPMEHGKIGRKKTEEKWERKFIHAGGWAVVIFHTDFNIFNSYHQR